MRQGFISPLLVKILKTNWEFFLNISQTFTNVIFRVCQEVDFQRVRDNVGSRPETKQQLGENEYLLVPGYMYYKKYLLVYNWILWLGCDILVLYHLKKGCVSIPLGLLLLLFYYQKGVCFLQQLYRHPTVMGTKPRLGAYPGVRLAALIWYANSHRGEWYVTAKSSQRWPKVAKSSQKLPKVAKNSQK